MTLAPAVSIASSAEQKPLGKTNIPFARYLNDLHRRIHPVYSDELLGRELSVLPPTHPLNTPDLSTLVELTIDGESGALQQATAVRASGVPEFDELVINALEKTAPFSRAATEIRSSDGKVYIHWVFHRRPDYACSTYFSRPYLLSFPD